MAQFSGLPRSWASGGNTSCLHLPHRTQDTLPHFCLSPGEVTRGLQPSEHDLFFTFVSCTRAISLLNWVSIEGSGLQVNARRLELYARKLESSGFFIVGDASGRDWTLVKAALETIGFCGLTSNSAPDLGFSVWNYHSPQRLYADLAIN